MRWSAHLIRNVRAASIACGWRLKPVLDVRAFGVCDAIGDGSATTTDSTTAISTGASMAFKSESRQVVGAGPNARRAERITACAIAAFALPPMTAPMPKGTMRPRTTSPCFVPYLVTKLCPRTLLIALIWEVGIRCTSCRAQCLPVRSATELIAWFPLSPSMIARNKLRRRSRSEMCTPWTSANAKVYSAAASRNTPDSPALSVSAAAVRTRGPLPLLRPLRHSP